MPEFSSEPNSVTRRGHALPGRMRHLSSASMACRIRYRRIVLKQLRSVTIFQQRRPERELRIRLGAGRGAGAVPKRCLAAAASPPVILSAPPQATHILISALRQFRGSS